MKPAEFHRIDMETWPRREHYEYYKNLVKTSYNLTAYVDISKLLFRCNETKQRFYPTFVYSITKAVNEIKELRMALDKGSKLEIYAQYDLSDEWLHICTMFGTDLRSFTVPIRPRRTDHFKLRFVGEGEAKLYSITKTIEQGSDLS